MKFSARENREIAKSLGEMKSTNSAAIRNEVSSGAARYASPRAQIESRIKNHRLACILLLMRVPKT